MTDTWMSALTGESSIVAIDDLRNLARGDHAVLSADWRWICHAAGFVGWSPKILIRDREPPDIRDGRSSFVPMIAVT